MKKVTCPCGSEFKSHTDDELVALVQEHAMRFHNETLTREHILDVAVQVEGFVMHKVVCPPCGAEFVTHDELELVEMVQRHAKTQHAKDLTREDILRTATVVA